MKTERTRERERQWQEEQEEIAWQREREKHEWEAQREHEEREFRLKEQETELQKLQLQSQSKSAGDSSPYFDITKHIRIVPPFQEQEVDKYFLHFGKVAKNCNWPKIVGRCHCKVSCWAKPRKFFPQLSIEDSSKYDKVKQLILKGYESAF